MRIERDSLKSFEFFGLEIRDYTAGREGSSSIAEIKVPAGARHERAWSKRSDKYYYVIEGRLRFIVDNQVLNLSTGDVCIIPQGTRFSYENQTGETTKLLVVHTPSFKLNAEIFEE
ncbi:MAG: cupin domain-containing protein [Chloroflexota bacterium]|nr:cupin domain-containing protein [Chloroflexota bacterium]